MQALPPIHYYIDNKRYDFKVRCLITIFILGVIFSLLVRSWLVVGIFVVLIFAAYTWYNQPDGKLEFFIQDGKWWVKNTVNTQTSISAVVSQEFSWHYDNMLEPSVVSSARNAVILKLEIRLSPDSWLTLIHELYQWQETPVGWNYKIRPAHCKHPILVAYNDLISLKRSCEAG